MTRIPKNMDAPCVVCGGDVAHQREGRPRQYCSESCRKKRQSFLQKDQTEVRRKVRADAERVVLALAVELANAPHTEVAPVVYRLRIAVRELEAARREAA